VQLAPSDLGSAPRHPLGHLHALALTASQATMFHPRAADPIEALVKGGVALSGLFLAPHRGGRAPCSMRLLSFLALLRDLFCLCLDPARWAGQGSRSVAVTQGRIGATSLRLTKPRLRDLLGLRGRPAPAFTRLAPESGDLCMPASWRPATLLGYCGQAIRMRCRSITSFERGA